MKIWIDFIRVMKPSKILILEVLILGVIEIIINFPIWFIKLIFQGLNFLMSNIYEFLDNIPNFIFKGKIRKTFMTQVAEYSNIINKPKVVKADVRFAFPKEIK